MKLHLGCGEKYLDGYINIDYPSSEHTVQNRCAADELCDIQTLSYPFGTIEEVRLHHLFEHFSRQVALGLLCRWTDWLKSGGILHIETPDFQASVYRFVSPFTSFDEKQQILRHLFGSHEANWAFHLDAWYEEKFRAILNSLSYKKIKFKKSKWGATKNIEVTAIRGDKQFSEHEYQGIVQNFLCASLIKDPIKNGKIDLEKVAPSEVQMLNVWLKEWLSAYRK